MKKSEEKPSCKLRVESGEKTFCVVVGINEETILGIFWWERWWSAMLSSSCQGLELIEGRWRCWWLVCYNGASEIEREGVFRRDKGWSCRNWWWPAILGSGCQGLELREGRLIAVLVSGDWWGTVLWEKQRESEKERWNFLFWRRGKGKVVGWGKIRGYLCLLFLCNLSWWILIFNIFVNFSLVLETPRVCWVGVSETLYTFSLAFNMEKGTVNIFTCMQIYVTIVSPWLRVYIGP